MALPGRFGHRRHLPGQPDPGVLRRDRVPGAGHHGGLLPRDVGLTVLDRDVLAVPVTDAARALLGVRLVRDDATGRRIGRIVEVEAYGGPDDAASHARFGMTPRNQVMYGPPGRAYVYLVYGMHDCLNVVTGVDGAASAVLIRAVEPLLGHELMRGDRWVHRMRSRRAAAQAGLGARDHVERTADERLASGPGLVGAAFGLDTSWTGLDLCAPVSPLRLESLSADDAPVGEVVATPRIGVDHAGGEWAARPWRFAIAAHPSVSRSAR